MILATLLVRDEEDIVEQNIIHHINQGIDKFIITDHKSEDNTLKIIKKFSQVVEIIEEKEEAYNQHKWVTNMAHLALKYNPDWIVHLDADEFWQGFEILDTLDKDITLVKSAECLNLQENTGKTCKEYKPLLKNIKAKIFNKEDFGFYEYSFRRSNKGQKIIHRPQEGIRIHQGNHDAENYYGLSINCPEITIDHYPIRSYEHFVKKVKNGGEAYKKSSIDYQTGLHWRKWYDLLLEGKLFEEYKRISI